MNLLVFIDLQEGFRSTELLSILPNIKRLITNFNGIKVCSIFVNEINSQFEQILQWKNFQKGADQKLIKELTEYPLKYFKHNGYTVLTDELLRLIQKRDISTLYISGVYTDVSIVKTAMDSFDKSIQGKVIEDACASLHGKNSHNQAIESLKHIIGEKNIVQTKELVK